jgi:ferric-dicitrate binding protein FerR (iron transport regulator)
MPLPVENSDAMLTQNRSRSEARSQAKEQARKSAQKQADIAKEQFGELAFEALEQYFPEQAKSRRRQHSGMTLLIGVVIGVVLYALLSRSQS